MISFSEFYRIIHGYAPYLWQEQLAEKVIEQWSWPDHVGAPTGMGKTSTLDIAVYALYRDVAEHGVGNRKLPQRIFLAVERRIVVDGAHEHANRIAHAIDNDPWLVDVKNTLRRLLPDFYEGATVGSYSLHGGVRQNREWLRPFGAMIVTCTVTQLGSRMMFRGVGTTVPMRSFAAGITGVDRLILMDEAHLQPSAVRTFREIESLQSPYEEALGVPTGSTVVLGATVPPEISSSVEDSFHADVMMETSDLAIKKREVAKHAVLHKVDNVEKEIVSLTLQSWKERGDEGDGLLVIVSSIKSAARIAAEVSKKIRDKDADVRLITSSVRAVDRPKLKDFTPNTITIATQTVEVGIDLNCSCLITDLPAMPALIQRFGRLNRSCFMDSARGHIVFSMDKEQKVKGITPLIYGEDQVDATYFALMSSCDDQGLVSFNPAPECEGTWLPASRSLYFYDMLDNATSTYSDYPLDWSPFLYGADKDKRAEVTVLWRDNPEEAEIFTPVSSESITIPLSALTAFLTGSAATRIDSSDAPMRIDESSAKGWCADDKVAYLYTYPGVSRIAKVKEINPGDTVIIDSMSGGYSKISGWDPSVRDHVEDVYVRAVLDSGYGKLKVSDVVSAHLLEDIAAEKVNVEDAVRASIGDDFHLISSEVIMVGTTGWSNDGSARVTLADHSKQVADFTLSIAHVSGVRCESEVYSAGLCHDAGKETRDFQLRMGNWALNEPQAKSVGKTLMNPTPGYRHEIDSLNYCDDDPTVRHLVASHHGRRKIIHHDGEQRLMMSEYRAAEEKFGAWGVALLESIVRSADWNASAQPIHSGHKWLDVLEEMDSLRVEGDSSDGNRDAQEVVLSGVNTDPILSILAAIGYIGECGRLGDPHAAVRWSDEGIVVNSTCHPDEWDEEFWSSRAEEINTVLMMFGGKVPSKSAKYSVGDISDLHDSLHDLVRAVFYYFHSSPPSTKDEEAGHVHGGSALSIPFFDNNSAFFLKFTSRDGVGVFFDQEAGYSLDTTGGGTPSYDMDLEVSSAMRMDKKIYVRRKDLLVWALVGVMYLGVPYSEQGIGVMSSDRSWKLRLPITDRYVTLDEYKELVKYPGDGEVASFVKTSPSQYMSVWREE